MEDKVEELKATVCEATQIEALCFLAAQEPSIVVGECSSFVYTLILCENIVNNTIGLIYYNAEIDFAVAN